MQVQGVSLQQEAAAYTDSAASEDSLLALDKPLAPDYSPLEEFEESIGHYLYECFLKVRED